MSDTGDKKLKAGIYEAIGEHLDDADIADLTHVFAEYFEADKAAAVTEAEQNVLSTIRSIARDLAINDGQICAASISPYISNAMLVYEEYLKGDDFERIDWRALNLSTLNELQKEQP